MRKLLIILLIINIIALSVSFLMMLGINLLYSIILLAFGILELIPIIAIISCLDNIENLQYENKYLYEKLKKLEDVSLDLEPQNAPVKTDNPNTAPAVWECVKCSTVNKAGTEKCSNCNAPYSPFLNPTDDPKRKKKISRFVKFK